MASFQPVEISNDKQYSYMFSIATLVTNHDEYAEMVHSAQSAGFSGEDVEYIYLDNSEVNRYDGFSGLNHFMNIAEGKYLIVCHQDVIFEFDNCETLKQRIAEINSLDKNWGILGNAGKKFNSESAIRITDPGAKDLSTGEFPQQVMTLDENFLLINMDHRLSTTNNLSGFHLYGTDLCINAQNLGLNSYVINFHLRHKSSGNPDKSYFDTQEHLIEIYRQRKQTQVIQSMCSRFFVSPSPLINRMMNRRKILNLHKSVKKRFT